MDVGGVMRGNGVKFGAGSPWFALLGLFVASCSGSDPVERADPEICDDGIDNDGNGLVDCEDSNACGGLACRDPGDDDDDDTGPPPVIEIQFDESACCDFEFGQSDCPQKVIGTFSVINRSEELDGQLDVFCDRVGPDADQVVQWRPQGSSQLRGTLVNVPVPAASSLTLEGVFVCATGVNQDFTTDCTVFADVGEDETEYAFTISATSFVP